MTMNRFSLVVASLLVAACGSSGDGSNGNGNGNGAGNGGGDAGQIQQPSNDAGAQSNGDAGSQNAIDSGAPSATYPAFTPQMPTVVKNTGTVLQAPKIVLVTWPGDTNTPQFEAFVDALGTSDYWKQVTSEYGIQPATSGTINHVHMTTPFSTSWSGGDIDTIVSVNVTGVASGAITPDATKWPAPDANTVYMLVLPAAAQLNQDDCSQRVGGYHSETSNGGYVYGITDQCDFGGSLTALEETFVSMSHEIAEATLDPHPGSGYVTLDDGHFAWELLQSVQGQPQDETGDMCEVYDDVEYEQKETTPAFDFFVQRQWSNKSGAAGHNPCVPVPADPYFNVALVSPQQIKVNLSKLGGASSVTTLGVPAKTGQTVSFQVGFYSDAPMDAWTLLPVDGSEVSTLYGDKVTTHFSNITIDNPKGQNGQMATVTLTLNTSNSISGELLTLVSSKGGNLCDKAHRGAEVCHYMPILIGGL